MLSDLTIGRVLRALDAGERTEAEIADRFGLTVAQVCELAEQRDA